MTHKGITRTSPTFDSIDHLTLASNLTISLEPTDSKHSYLSHKPTNPAPFHELESIRQSLNLTQSAFLRKLGYANGTQYSIWKALGSVPKDTLTKAKRLHRRLTTKAQSL